jgi:hypothetical protein
MKKGFYYCDAHQLTLGFSDAYQLHWDRDKTTSAIAKINDSKRIVDEFGDEWTSVDCAISSESIPVKKLRYQHTCGDTGFDDFSKNDAGHSPDPELKRLFESILADAWTWSYQRKEFICYAHEKTNLDYPGEFFYGKESKAPLISIHSPNAALLKQFSSARDGREEEPGVTAIYKLQGVEKLKALFNIAGECRVLLVWQLSDGLNPIAISENIDDVLNRFGELCATESIPFRKVEAEKNLPAW